MSNTNSDAGNVLTLAADAFKALETSTKLDGKGRQMLAYCIMSQHYEDVRSERKPPALSAMKTSPKAAREYNGTLAKLFIGERPVMTKDKSDASFRAAKSYAARYAHLQRAVSLAGDLQQAGVGIASFDHKAGMFRVAPDVICDPNMTPIDQLAKRDTVLIDGTTYMVKRGDGFTSINASLSRVTDAASAKRAAANPKPAAASPPANGASDTATTGGASAEKIVSKISTFSFDALVLRAADILNDDSVPQITRTDITPEVFNALADLATVYQRMIGETPAVVVQKIAA